MPQLLPAVAAAAAAAAAASAGAPGSGDGQHTAPESQALGAAKDPGRAECVPAYPLSYAVWVEPEAHSSPVPCYSLFSPGSLSDSTLT